MPSQTVLTVNQAFAIHSNWLELRDWEEAFSNVIPEEIFVGGKGQGQMGEEEGP